MLFYPIKSSHAGLLLEHCREIFAGHAKFVCIETDVALSLEILGDKNHESHTFPAELSLQMVGYEDRAYNIRDHNNEPRKGVL